MTMFAVIPFGSDPFTVKKSNGCGLVGVIVAPSMRVSSGSVIVGIKPPVIETGGSFSRYDIDDTFRPGLPLPLRSSTGGSFTLAIVIVVVGALLRLLLAEPS